MPHGTMTVIARPVLIRPIYHQCNGMSRNHSVYAKAPDRWRRTQEGTIPFLWSVWPSSPYVKDSAAFRASPHWTTRCQAVVSPVLIQAIYLILHAGMHRARGYPQVNGLSTEARTPTASPTSGCPAYQEVIVILKRFRMVTGPWVYHWWVQKISLLRRST